MNNHYNIRSFFAVPIIDSLLKVSLGLILLFASAQISIPIGIVPITLHTVAVLCLALCYSHKEALAAIVAYLIFGAVGLPMFTNFASGISVLLGPKGGYYFGFIACIHVVSLLRARFGDNSWQKLLAYSLVGTIVIYLIGVLQLSVFTGFYDAIKFGFLPFIIVGIIKGIITAFMVSTIKRWKFFV